MLIQYNISSTPWQEKACVKVTVSQQHSQTCLKYWQATNQQNTNKAQSPHKQWQTVKGHSLSTHICYGYKEINRSQNTTYTSYVQTKDSKIHRSARVTQSTAQRWIRSPADPLALFHKPAQQQQSKTARQNPEANIIHTRKCHIRCTNHYWYQPILCFIKQNGLYLLQFFFITVAPRKVSEDPKNQFPAGYP